MDTGIGSAISKRVIKCLLAVSERINMDEAKNERHAELEALTPTNKKEIAE